MNNFFVSEMTLDDIPNLTALFADLYDDLADKGSPLRLNPRYLTDYLNLVSESERTKIFCLFEDDVLCGFVCASIMPLNRKFRQSGNESYGFVSELYVSPEQRNRGYGLELLREAEAFFARMGIRCIELSVVAGNEGALKFYEQHGFKRDYYNLRKEVDPDDVW